jgi:hypothetical protein
MLTMADHATTDVTGTEWRSEPSYILPWLSKGGKRPRPVDRRVLKVVGHKTAGKDEVGNHLTRLRPDAKKANTVAIYRPARSGEDLSDRVGVVSSQLEEVLDSDEVVLTFYPVRDIFYFLVESAYQEGTPVMHISGTNGVETIQKSGMFPRSLDVLITLDTDRNDVVEDLRKRAIWRLAKYRSIEKSDWKHDTNWDYETGSPQDKAKIDAVVNNSLEDMGWFEDVGAKLMPYHAIFDNNKPADDDVRLFLQNRTLDRDVVTNGIALRLNALLTRSELVHQQRDISYDKIDYARIRENYVTDCVVALVGKGPAKSRKGNHLPVSLYGPDIASYVEGRNLSVDRLTGFMSMVRLESSARSKTHKGRHEIILSPSNGGHAIEVADLRAGQLPYDAHVMGVIAERIFRTTGTLPRYEVANGIVKRMVYGLSDRVLGKGRQELSIGYR